ncbi:MAG TPA: sugar phosphate isomerase/epimerase family protein [Chitinophagaceae bacterium]|jgi:sugar phosphate isomerase/epimerase|nr:sugar phosphate isomerase/epimerase family protein [Chitinophagaceae bacterium]
MPARTFVRFGIFLLLSLGSGRLCAQRLPPLGLAGSLEQDSLVYAAGFRLTGTSVGSLLAPTIPGEQFQKNIRKVKEARCRVYMCNVLFPGNLKIAGPEVDTTKVLSYLESVLVRAQQAGIPNLVLGSGGARRLPDGYDAASALPGFVALAQAMAGRAERYGITIILEALNRSETNFINTLKEAAAVVRRVDHPHFRLNADIYHMLKEGESPKEIRKARKYIVYAEIAEKEKRTFPGITGEDFRPYLRALRRIRYYGPIMIEGRSDNIPADAPKAFAYLTQQLQSVY